MTNEIRFRMVAYTGAAGKATPSAPMGGNEDNFYVDDNLSDNIPCHFDVDKIQDLAEYGLIMAVADGMGGQNAGEVASSIAVKTVNEFFSPGVLNDKIVKTPDTRKIYLEKLVIEADRRIKEDANNNPEHEGMGSTIILAWILGDKLTITWCGDSRAYRYNPAKGIELLSEDHSYVQELVKQKVISYDDTFDHPQGNIVTRSLGERGNKAQPETRQFNLYKNDIILLCSDGLSGVLRDKKTFDRNGELYPGENIEDIIKENSSSMKLCKDALWCAAERADWYDNVTIILCQILDGAPILISGTPNYDDNEKKVTDNRFKNFWSKSLHITTRNIAASIGIIILMAILIASCLWIYPKITHNNKENVEHEGTIPNEDVGEHSSALGESLMSLLQTECANFMKLCNISNMEEADYFKEIIDKINRFNAPVDTISINELRNYTFDFIKLTQKRANQLQTINDSMKAYTKNKIALEKLQGLKKRCIEDDINDNDFQRNLGDSLLAIGSNSDSGTFEGGEDNSITPIDPEERFNVSNWDDFIKKVGQFKEKYNSNYTFKGVYVEDAIVYDDNGVVEKNKELIKEGETLFTIKFTRN